MRPRQSLPAVWLLSDARNDARLEDALRALPTGSGVVFRHYHLKEEAERRAAFERLAVIARTRGHTIVLSASQGLAREWGADGIYGATETLGPPSDLLRLATAHDGVELQAASAAGADAVFLSPVFPTRSHPDAEALGPMGFSVLAQQVSIPVIALGGMTRTRAAAYEIARWGAIDGLV